MVDIAAELAARENSHERIRIHYSLCTILCNN